MSRATDLSYQHPQTGEWAHHIKDPHGEALHCFVNPALEVRLPSERDSLRILEIGFGRGANTAAALEKLREINYAGQVSGMGLEPNPAFLEPWPQKPPDWGEWPWWNSLETPWTCQGRLWSGFVKKAKAPAALPAEPWADWVFLDLFSPNKHPQDWPDGLIRALSKASRPGAVLTSYCCARTLRNRLREAGWQVERLTGDFRRDHLRARMP
ncbi:MAG: hypothetical protein CMJ96_08170 [Planctomycetes bacterium]|nr:hypothetical protein [Planctomycetota bacterium]MDP7246494.1 MnmC family methyltransferase [Planctomycetota bacterium]